MKILCVMAEHQYGDATRGLGLESSCFIPALREEGHEVRLFDALAQGKFHSYDELNIALLAEVEAWRPQLLLSVLLDVELWSETLAAIRRLGVRAISWATDDTWKWRKVSRYIAHDYDGMITTHEGALAAYRDIGVQQVHLSQWAAPSAYLQEPLPASACTYPVSFVGIAYGDRVEIIKALAVTGIAVHCFGYQWPSGPVEHQAIPGIMRNSIISLNFSKGLYGGPNQIKARIFEVPGAGGFLLTEDSPDLSRWYALGEEIDVFHNEASLAERIRFYLANPQVRDRMATRAHARTRAEHTYRQRMRGIVAFAETLPEPKPSPCADMESAIRMHAASWYLRWLRRCLIAACRLIWGRQRSWAYARRMAFEISWRLSGRRTFQARGWFGRMFPQSSIPARERRP
jgi:spore maturation protein CgeB